MNSLFGWSLDIWVFVIYIFIWMNISEYCTHFLFKTLLLSEFIDP
jgi:hypothetical protein